MANTPFQVPQPQAIAGLQAVMVYGENFQVAVGLNHQIAVGSNVQLCVNPSVLEELFNVPPSPTFAAMCGSGVGGNMQFTIGSSTNVTWGRTFNITIGPEPVEIKNDQRHPLARAFCMLISAAVLAHIIIYGILSDDNDRAKEVIVFQVLMDLLLAMFMRTTLLNRTINMTTSQALLAFFNSEAYNPSDAGEVFRDLTNYALFAGAIAAPIILIAKEENHFQGDTQDSASPQPCPPPCPPANP